MAFHETENGCSSSTRSEVMKTSMRSRIFKVQRPQRLGVTESIIDTVITTC